MKHLLALIGLAAFGLSHAPITWSQTDCPSPYGEPDPNGYSTINAAYFDTDGSGTVDVPDLMNLLSAYGVVVAQAFACGDAVSYQGYDYATVLIGDQCWFAENLRSENYDNGDAIPSGLSDEEWMNTTSGATAVYGEDAGCSASAPDFDACDPVASLEAYGRLYNWYAVVDERGLCPAGWHPPSDAEWMELEMALGMSEADAGSTFWRGTDQGNQMKSTTGWANSGNGTNASGMTLLPGGYRYGFDEAAFVIAGNFACMWTASEMTWGAYIRLFMDNRTDIKREQESKDFGMSVRCLQD